MKQGIVVRSTGSWYEVRLESGDVIPCRMVGKFRLQDKPVTNPVAVGDKVEVEMVDGEDTAMIKSIGDRDNYVIRQSPRKKHYLHILAANIDQAMLVITIASPKLKQGFIDRFLLMTEPYDIPVHIVFNKSDLYNTEDFLTFEYLEEVYHKIGYQVHLVSSVTGEGLDNIRHILKDNLTLIAGQSGVGKSTFINKLQPELALRVGDISDYTGKGQHTTTFAEMFELKGGGQIIDTPGIKTLSFNHFETMDIAHNFKEIFAEATNCKFDDCYHREEPKCAVKAAIEAGEISELRYFNYLQLLDEVEGQNYWERKKDY